MGILGTNSVFLSYLTLSRLHGHLPLFKMVFSSSLFLLSAFFSAFSLPSSEASYQQCDFDQLLSALHTFATVAKLPQGVSYSSNDTNLEKTQTKELENAYLTNGAHGASQRFFDFCNGKREMYQKLGPKKFAHCIDATTFLAHGYKTSAAIMFKKFFERLRYECGSAFPTFMKNMDKFMFANINMTDSFKPCLKAYLHGQGSRDECGVLQSYYMCQSNVYLTASGSLDLAYAVCETTRRGEIVRIPECSTPEYFCSFEKLSQMN
ncbi:hypothetical protein L596_011388 [Steinernema carpocapsae]|uniref:Uncharacterized protein n=1 Tax=Steinernema carpocapsae TaxID=34508 RepID=A0A4U5NUM1_STECR|nr:hypothetical protein L596_011388 [Steinernema carpocapsae]